MSKETEKMRDIRIQRIGIKEVLSMAEQTSKEHRQTIASNWDKEDKPECRKALYKAHKSLVKSRSVVRECQRMLGETKRSLRALNRQHDYREKAVKEHNKEVKEYYPKTSLLG